MPVSLGNLDWWDQDPQGGEDEQFEVESKMELIIMYMMEIPFSVKTGRDTCLLRKAKQNEMKQNMDRTTQNLLLRQEKNLKIRHYSNHCNCYAPRARFCLAVLLVLFLVMCVDHGPRKIFGSCMSRLCLPLLVILPLVCALCSGHRWCHSFLQHPNFLKFVYDIHLKHLSCIPPSPPFSSHLWLR